jgi:tRNA (guanine-N7-)-methyltransferase
MSRSLKYEIPGEDRRLSIADVAATGWDAIFAKSRAASDGEPGGSRKRVLEIGFGRGEYLLGMAEGSPEVDFVGIEISFKRTLKMARKVARAKLANVRLLEARAQVVLRQIFLPGSLSEIWVNFSDPWPKARHAHRRVIQPAFAIDAARALEPGGILYVATDDVRYASQIGAVLSAEERLFNLYAPWPFLNDVPGRALTGYEEQWRAAGRPMHFFAYSTTDREYIG